MLTSENQKCPFNIAAALDNETCFTRVLPVANTLCFLLSDYGFSQILCNSSNVDKIFLSQLNKYVTKFENRLINNRVLVKNIFESAFLIQKFHGREVNISRKNFKLLVFHYDR